MWVMWAPPCWLRSFHDSLLPKRHHVALTSSLGLPAIRPPPGQLTQFSKIMSSMADVSQTYPFLEINTYLPVVLVVHCAMVALGVWDRLFNLCTSSRFSFKFSTHDVDDEYTEKVRCC